MKNFNAWNTITIFGLVLFLIICAVFNILIGVAFCAFLLGVFLTVMLDAVFRDLREDDLTREEIEQARKENYL